MARVDDERDRGQVDLAVGGETSHDAVGSFPHGAGPSQTEQGDTGSKDPEGSSTGQHPSGISMPVMPLTKENLTSLQSHYGVVEDVQEEGEGSECTITGVDSKHTDSDDTITREHKRSAAKSAARELLKSIAESGLKFRFVSPETMDRLIREMVPIDATKIPAFG